jgi:hypothetical protein
MRRLRETVDELSPRALANIINGIAKLKKTGYKVRALDQGLLCSGHIRAWSMRPKLKKTGYKVTAFGGSRFSTVSLDCMLHSSCHTFVRAPKQAPGHTGPFVLVIHHDDDAGDDTVR